MITAASLATMTDFAKSGLSATEWTKNNRARLSRDVVLPMQAIMTEVERIWGDDFQRLLTRRQGSSGVRLLRDRVYLGAVSQQPAWLHAATAVWMPVGFSNVQKTAPRIELRLGNGYWETGFAFTKTGRVWMHQMAANLMPNKKALERMLDPLLGGNHFDWCVRERERVLAPEGHGIVRTWESREARDFFDGVSAWDRVISATTAFAWDTLPDQNVEKFIQGIVRMVQRVYPLIILTTAIDSDTALRGIENYLILLAKEHPQMLPKHKNTNIIQFPSVRS